MNVSIIGGGPTGLYYAILHKKNYPDDKVEIFERNAPNNTFGWGVVFSDATIKNLEQADESSAKKINHHLNHWEDIDTLYKGEKLTSTGHGFIGIGRLQLLNILQKRCEELGVELQYNHNIEDIQQIKNADLIIASDGINSVVRNKYEQEFETDIDERICKFAWFGTHKLFDAFTFIFENTKFGWMAVHAYKFNKDTSTFIIEMTEDTWFKAGFDKMEQEEAIKFCETIFAKHLDGNGLLNNAKHTRGSANWMKFPRIICGKWHTWQNIDNKKTPIVLMGDSSHTAHYSIGSGTKLGLEDAITFKRLLLDNDKDLSKVLNAYEVERRVEVAKIRNAARNSTWWFENVLIHEKLPSDQFYYSLLTRSQRISHENLYVRDNDFIKDYEVKMFAGKLPLESSYKIKNMELANRCVLELYGQSDDSNYYVEQAKYGASLIISEPCAVCESGMIDNSTVGVWNQKQIDFWENTVTEVQKSGVKIALHLNHAGFKSNSYSTFNKSLANIDKQQIVELINFYQSAAKNCIKVNADAVMLNLADGYLLNSFLSPLTNNRNDDYGGNFLTNRMRLPSEIVDVVRKEIDLPLIVKINASDWDKDGFEITQAIELSLNLQSIGVDALVISSGGVVPNKHLNGRMFNGCFADEIKAKTDLPIILTGNISTIDQVNTIVAAARADFAALDFKNILSNNLVGDIKQIITNR